MIDVDDLPNLEVPIPATLRYHMTMLWLSPRMWTTQWPLRRAPCKPRGNGRQPRSLPTSGARTMLTPGSWTRCYSDCCCCCCCCTSPLSPGRFSLVASGGQSPRRCHTPPPRHHRDPSRCPRRQYPRCCDAVQDCCPAFPMVFLYFFQKYPLLLRCFGLWTRLMWTKKFVGPRSLRWCWSSSPSENPNLLHLMCLPLEVKTTSKYNNTFLTFWCRQTYNPVPECHLKAERESSFGESKNMLINCEVACRMSHIFKTWTKISLIWIDGLCTYLYLSMAELDFYTPCSGQEIKSSR